MGGQGREGMPSTFPASASHSLHAASADMTPRRRQGQTSQGPEESRQRRNGRRGDSLQSQAASRRQSAQRYGRESEGQRTAQRGAAGHQEEWQEVKRTTIKTAKITMREDDDPNGDDHDSMKDTVQRRRRYIITHGMVVKTLIC
jgi:hypothetical protein